MFRVRPHMCERAREWGSLALDGELSELERVLLDSHLRRCAACAAYVVEITAISETIRATELEPVPRPVAIPLRRRLAFASRALPAGAAAAAVIAVTLGLGTQLGVPENAPADLTNNFRLPASAISSGPNSEADRLIRAPRLANLKAMQGIGDRQRGLRIDS
jgi:ferric-dicitrate binding protein FerR (iron transport regulator)